MKEQGNGIILPSHMLTTKKTISQQNYSARNVQLVHQTITSPQRPANEPRDLTDSAEDTPGVYPGNLPGHFVMYT